MGDLERRGDGRLFYRAVIFNVRAPGAAVVAVVSCATFAGRIVFGYKHFNKVYFVIEIQMSPLQPTALFSDLE